MILWDIIYYIVYPTIYCWTFQYTSQYFAQYIIEYENDVNILEKIPQIFWNIVSVFHKSSLITKCTQFLSSYNNTSITVLISHSTSTTTRSKCCDC